MKKISTIVFAAFSVILFFGISSVNEIFAQEQEDQSQDQYMNLNLHIPPPSRYNSLEEVISALGSLIRPIFILTFTAMILYGAWVRLTSQGDDAKLTKSVKIITAAIIGFIIAVFAPTIVNLIIGLLGVEGEISTKL